MKKVSNILDKTLFYFLPLLIIIFGIYLRLFLFFQNYPLWNDEILLADNIMTKSYLQLFFPLENIQVAPPLFLIIQKFIVKICHYNVLSFRVLAIISGCISVPLFYKLLYKNFKSRFAIIFGLFLFAFNPQLIAYSNEFKPYSLDVLICILLLLLYEKLNIKDNRFLFLYSLLMFIIPFFSFPSIIVSGAVIVFKIITEKNDKLKSAFLLIPLVFSTTLLWLIEHIHYKEMTEYVLWHDAFFNLSLEHNYHLFEKFLEYVQFDPLIYGEIILCVIISLFFVKNKLMNLSILSILFCCAASFLKMFPFSQRLILFLFPVLIILISGIFEQMHNIPLKSDVLKKCFSIIIFVVIFINLHYDFEDILITKNFPVLELKKTRITRENTIINLLEHYTSDDLIVTTPKIIPYIRVYNVIKKYNKQLNIKTNNLLPAEAQEEIKSLDKLIACGENNDFWFIYFNPWIQINYPSYDQISEELFGKHSLEYTKYENGYASAYYVKTNL